ncbi:MAG TPA: ribosomal-protein-alanine N-acetyltransferase [Devosia sp.]|nr:ribosomal-protein-alanine N-acetyltransferase [Devosia sp.]
MKIWMAPAGLHVEPGLMKDAKNLARLHTAAFFRGWSESELAAYISTPHKTPLYVACNARRHIAGFVVLQLAGDEAELLSIVVAPRWRGRGLGEALLRAGIDDLRTTPVERMFLEVDEANEPAIRLYRRFGFIEVGKRKGYFPLRGGSPATALVMRCEFV